MLLCLWWTVSLIRRLSPPFVACRAVCMQATRNWMGSWEGGYSKQQSLWPGICDLSVIFQWESLLVHVVSCWSVPMSGDGPYIMPPALMVLSVSSKQSSRPDKIVGLTWLAQIESYLKLKLEDLSQQNHWSQFLKKQLQWHSYCKSGKFRRTRLCRK